MSTRLEKIAIELSMKEIRRRRAPQNAGNNAFLALVKKTFNGVIYKLVLNAWREGGEQAARRVASRYSSAPEFQPAPEPINRQARIVEYKNGLIEVFFSADGGKSERRLYQGRTFTNALEETRATFFGEI